MNDGTCDECEKLRREEVDAIARLDEAQSTFDRVRRLGDTGQAQSDTWNQLKKAVLDADNERRDVRRKLAEHQATHPRL